MLYDNWLMNYTMAFSMIVVYHGTIFGNITCQATRNTTTTNTITHHIPTTCHSKLTVDWQPTYLGY